MTLHMSVKGQWCARLTDLGAVGERCGAVDGDVGAAVVVAEARVLLQARRGCRQDTEGEGDKLISAAH